MPYKNKEDKRRNDRLWFKRKWDTDPDFRSRVLESQKHNERRREYRKTYFGEHKRLRTLALSNNSRCRRAGIEGVLTELDLYFQYVAQGGLCYYCWEDLTTSCQLDHKTPLSRGGNNCPENVILSCPKCNRDKWAKTSEEYKGLFNLPEPDIELDIEEGYVT